MVPEQEVQAPAPLLVKTFGSIANVGCAISDIPKSTHAKTIPTTEPIRAVLIAHES